MTFFSVSVVVRYHRSSMLSTQTKILRRLTGPTSSPEVFKIWSTLTAWHRIAKLIQLFIRLSLSLSYLASCSAIVDTVNKRFTFRHWLRSRVIHGVLIKQWYSWQLVDGAIVREKISRRFRLSYMMIMHEKISRKYTINCFHSRGFVSEKIDFEFPPSTHALDYVVVGSLYEPLFASSVYVETYVLNQRFIFKRQLLKTRIILAFEELEDWKICFGKRARKLNTQNISRASVVNSFCTDKADLKNY